MTNRKSSRSMNARVIKAFFWKQDRTKVAETAIKEAEAVITEITQYAKTPEFRGITSAVDALRQVIGHPQPEEEKWWIDLKFSALLIEDGILKSKEDRQKDLDMLKKKIHVVVKLADQIHHEFSLETRGKTC